MGAIDFWFEFGSTYSYPAAMRIEAQASSYGVAVSWRPFLLGPIFREQGWADSPFNIYPATGRYMWRDLERVCAHEGLSLRRPSTFPRSGLLAARLSCSLSSEPWLPDFVRSVYVANFEEDRDISDVHVIEAILEALGQPSDLVAKAALPETKAQLRAQTDRAIALGIFGAPTFVVDGELFWGNDRLESALSCAQLAGQTRAV